MLFKQNAPGNDSVVVVDSVVVDSVVDVVVDSVVDDVVDSVVVEVDDNVVVDVDWDDDDDNVVVDIVDVEVVLSGMYSGIPRHQLLPLYHLIYK